MRTQLTKLEAALLERSYQHTQVMYSKSGRWQTSCYLPLRGKPEHRAAERLHERGLVEYWDGMIAHLTDAGFACFLTTPKQMRLRDLRLELAARLADRRRSKQADKPNTSQYHVEFIRDLYQRPELTVWDVASIERQRIFQNQQLYEYDIQELECEISRVELAKES